MICCFLPFSCRRSPNPGKFMSLVIASRQGVLVRRQVSTSSRQGLRAKPPEGAHQTEAGEDLFCFIDGLTAEFGGEAVGVPGLRQFPPLLRLEYGAAGQTPRLTPSVHVLLRPEEQHSRSGEDDIVPPARRGDLEADEAGGPGQPAAPQRKRQRRPAGRGGRAPPGAPPKECRGS